MSTTVLTPQILKNAYSYAEYWQLIHDLIAENKTTGVNHSEVYLHYTKLNIQRMERQDQKITLNDAVLQALDAVKRPQTWVVLAEWWCGDVAQNLPTIAKIAEYSPAISLKIILRDENLELMDRYLTNGGRAIPKLIAFDSETGQELGNWGPRPQPAQDILMRWKENPNGKSTEDFHKELHLWYAQDKNETLMNELASLIRTWIHQPIVEKV